LGSLNLLSDASRVLLGEVADETPNIMAAVPQRWDMWSGTRSSDNKDAAVFFSRYSDRWYDLGYCLVLSDRFALSAGQAAPLNQHPTEAALMRSLSDEIAQAFEQFAI
jgi:hypothetical protein